MVAEADKPKRSLAWYDRGPGPAGYRLPPLLGRRSHALTHLINPEYTLRAKFPYEPKRLGPGPGAYLLPYGLKARGWDKTPAFTMRRKPTFCLKAFSPGPAEYSVASPNTYKYKQPAFTMRSRTNLLKAFQTPAPNSYLLPPAIGPKIPDKMAAVEITMKGNRDAKQNFYMPASAYNIGPCELIKPKAPAFSMRAKWCERYRGFPRVGPATYSPDKALNRPAAPAWHFAIRYNEFTGVFKTDCDKSSYEPLDC